MSKRFVKKVMPGNPNSMRTINVGMMTRVEGEGALHITVRDQEILDVELRIFESPRYFEAFLQGRHVHEVPDIVARICGICPVAYQMSAVHALEPIFGVQIPQPIQTLRRLLYCAEWIESHSLHIYMLHAPDFLGYESGLEMAKDYPEIVKRGLRLKKVGNQLLSLLGGRSVHPVSVKVGGFSRVPSKRELETLKEDLLWAREAAVETVCWTAEFEFNDPEQDYTFVALRSGTEYPMNGGLVTSSKGLEIDAADFEGHFQEKQVPYSNALHCMLNDQSYFAGPLARLHHNYERLSPLAKETFSSTDLSLPLQKASQGIVARSLEVLHAVDEALSIIDQYEKPNEPFVQINFQSGTGMAVTEAPRGLLYHRYDVNPNGTIKTVKIIPPTSQNQRRMEDDLRTFLPNILDRPDDEIARECEKILRSYDPCISCATHFLKVDKQDLPKSQSL